MKTTELKSILTDIKINNYEIEQGFDCYELALIMLKYIGNTDPELRDDLIYSTLLNWMINNIFSKEQLQEILRICLDNNHMFYKIGETETDSIFTRSFSVLLIAPIIYLHRQEAFLTEESVDNLYIKLIEYMETEKDVRGYINDKGWAHSVAHTADTIDELICCEEIDTQKLSHILKLIKDKISIHNYVFVNEEDERLTTAVVSIINREVIPTEKIIEWINTFTEYDEMYKYPEDQYVRINIKSFLRSLYFRLLGDIQYQNICNEISKALNTISKY